MTYEERKALIDRLESQINTLANWYEEKFKRGINPSKEESP